MCPDFRGVRISEASGIFSVGVAMLSSAMKAQSRDLPCCTLVRKADQRLYCVYQCYYSVQLLNQSAVMDNLALEASEHSHYPVNLYGSDTKGTEEPVRFTK